MHRLQVFFTIVAAVVLLAGPGQSVQAEVINPGFEQGAEGWRTIPMKTPTQVTFVEHGEGACLRVVGEAGSRMKITQSVAVEPQQWYRVRFMYFAEPSGDSGGNFGNFRGIITDPKGKFLDYVCAMTLFDTFGDWTPAELVFRTPLSTGQFALEFNASGACDVRLDDVVLEPTEAPAQPANTWSQYAMPRKDPLVFSSWQYTHDAKHFRQMGMKYGWRYRYDEQFDELKESRTIPLWGGDRVFKKYAEKGIRGLVYLHYSALPRYEAYYDGKPPQDIPRFIDPAWHDGLVQGCREACEKYGESPGIEYFFVVDEPYKMYTKAIIPVAKRVSPFWDGLDAEVQEKFGSGTYGLPDGPDDPNPYKWIAYCSWGASQLTDTFARLRQVVDDSECGAKILGPDELGIVCPEHWCDLAPSVDAFTGQSLNLKHSAQAYTTGYITKCAADFTAKPVHNATQIPLYGGSPSPEEVQRLYSQVLQNGGEGQMMLAVEWFDRELNHHKYSAPERWATVKNFLNIMATHQVQAPTMSRVGVLFSSPSIMSRGMNIGNAKMQAAYALCGPVVRAWPRMIDSYALAKGKADLEGLSTLIIPDAPYERPAVFEQIKAFVEQGGLLVCCDPDALQTDHLGEAFAREELFGATLEATGDHRFMAMTWPVEGRQRAFSGANNYVLKPTDDEAKVVGAYDDGSAAVVLNPYGEGSVLLFGTNPFATVSTTEDQNWKTFWEGLFRLRRVPMNLPIWDLRLPDEGLVQAQAPADVCLTGNSFVRCQNGVYLGANDPVDGSYAMSTAPDISKESVEGTNIPFAEGDLTDRATADDGPFEARKHQATTPYAEADWANRWSAKALAKGLDVEFALPEARPITRIRFWYSGAMPALTVEGIKGGVVGVQSKLDGANVGADVVNVEVALSGSYDRLRLRFAPGTKDFALADVEVWGEKTLATE
jgi:glycosyl hydrolase family 42 (putative beta-galactosidase)